MDKIIQEEVKIKCIDDVELSATLFIPNNEIKLAIMISPATGIKRIFYKAFSIFLAENGFAVLTFNNRGIGDSLNTSIKNCNASLQDWGELDMTAVLEYLKQRFPKTKYHLIGHSAGGQLVGLMKNSSELTSMFNFACSSGRVKNMTYPFKIQAIIFMSIFIPLNNLLFGYTNTHWIGMGEPLPKMVASQWALWCNGKGYVKTAFGKTVKKHWYDTLELPSIWINAIDDNIANNKNVDDMIKVFTKQKAETLTLIPSNYGLKEIGHMKFFSSKSKVLWKLALDWFENH